MPEAQVEQAGVDRGPDPAGERRDDARPGAPDDVEARHRVAVPGGGVPAALGPADDREEADALLLEPGPLLPRRELDVGLGPLPRPVVLGRGRSRRCRTSPAGPAPASRGPAAGAAPGSRRGRARRRTTTPGRRTTPPAPGRAAPRACRRRPARRRRPGRPGRPPRRRRRSRSARCSLLWVTAPTLAGRPRIAPSPRGRLARPRRVHSRTGRRSARTRQPTGAISRATAPHSAEPPPSAAKSTTTASIPTSGSAAAPAEQQPGPARRPRNTATAATTASTPSRIGTSR